jgi:hypothetical protein
VTAHSRAAALPASPSHGGHRTAVRLAEHRGRLGDALVFVIPLLLAIRFAVGGQLFLSEVVLLLALPFLLDDARLRGVSRVSRSALVLALLWLFGLIVTDLYRGSPFADYSRGWAKVAFLLINFAALSLLIDGRWRRVTLFAAGLALGEVLQFYFDPSTYAVGDPWKFGLGPPVTLMGALLASHPAIYRKPVLATGIFVVLGVVNLKLGFRSLGGVCFLSGFLVLLAARSAHLMRIDRRALRTFTALGACVLVGFIVVEAYGYAAGHGLLGRQAQQKYDLQQSSLGILSGRPEIVVAARAIRDSPIIGHGSWAKDPKYVAALQEELHRSGYGLSTVPKSQDLIPTHSHLFGAWVEAGILGALFWFWALALATSVLPRLHRLADGRVALVAFLAVSFLWDVLFSPFGAERRLVTPFYLIAFLLARKALSATSTPTRRS